MALQVTRTRDLARTKFLTVSILEQKEQLLPDSFACHIIRFDDKFSPNHHFVITEDFTRWIAIWMDSGQMWKKKEAGSSMTSRVL